jgi:DNA-binding LacI/PurR family transcriptional regulator
VPKDPTVTTSSSEPVPGRRPTIADVAALAGTSKGTVSFVLNDRPGVAAATRERVHAAMAELGWQPSTVARALSISRANVVGLVLNRTPESLRSDPFFAPFIAGLELGVAGSDVALLLRFVESIEDEEAVYRNLAKTRRVDGVVVADLRRDDSRIPLLIELRLPAVTLNEPDVPSPFIPVSSDDLVGFVAGVEHLIALGHRRIAHVRGPEVYLHADRRRQSWERAMRRHGLEPSLSVRSDFTAAGGAEATRTLLALPADERPTAILYANDLMAVAGMAVAHQMGLSLPRDLSVIGFDDAELAAYMHPALTTVRTDPLAWGQLTARTLLDLVHHGRRVQSACVGPAELIVRGSTTVAP